MKFLILHSGNIRDSQTERYIQKIFTSKFEDTEIINLNSIDLWHKNYDFYDKFKKNPNSENVIEIQKIIQKMKIADIIVWASPVYLKHITGVFKIFLDQISPFVHTMELAGKLGGVLVCSGGGETAKACQYLQDIQVAMGIKPIFKLELTNDLDLDIKKIQTDIINAITENEFNTNLELERYFAILKSNYDKVDYDYNQLYMHANYYEYDFMKAINLREIDSFQHFSKVIINDKESTSDDSTRI